MSADQEESIAGRLAAAEASNAHLAQYYLPQQPFGALEAVKRAVLASALRRLHMQQEDAMQRLQVALQSLENAELAMRCAWRFEAFIPFLPSLNHPQDK